MLDSCSPVGEGLQAGLNRGLDRPFATRGPCPLQEVIINVNESLGHDSSIYRIALIYTRYGGADLAGKACADEPSDRRNGGPPQLIPGTLG